MRKTVFLDGTTHLSDWRTPVVETLLASGVRRDQLFLPWIREYRHDGDRLYPSMLVRPGGLSEEEARLGPKADYVLFGIYYTGDPFNPIPACEMIRAAESLCRHPKRTIVMCDSAASGVKDRSIAREFYGCWEKLQHLMYSNRGRRKHSLEVFHDTGQMLKYITPLLLAE